MASIHASMAYLAADDSHASTSTSSSALAMHTPAIRRKDHLDIRAVSHKLSIASLRPPQHSPETTKQFRGEVESGCESSKTLRKARSLSSGVRRLSKHFSLSHTALTTKPPPPLPRNDFICGTTGPSTHSSYSKKSASSKGWFSSPYFSNLSLSSSYNSSPTSSFGSSFASSESSLVFPLHPDFELELDIALEMAPHELGSAWSHDSYNAMQYLRARTPYPPTMTETVFDYHAQGDKTSSGKSQDRWQSALELGCGPGQMSIHLATRFSKVYGQDPSPNMLKLANTVKHMSAEELAEVKLPPVHNPERIQFSQARGEDPILPPGEKVDLIMMAACIHWMDWETPESSKANWTKWSQLLKPGGSLIVAGGRPVIGPYTGEKGDQIRPLRDWLMDFPLDLPEINKYYSTGNSAIEELRKGGLYRKLRMPWTLEPQLAELWDSSSYLWIPIDDCTVLGDKATSARQFQVDDPEELANQFKDLPDWVRPNVRRAAQCDNSQGDLLISMTTPRKMADWVRSTSAYLKFMQDHPEQKTLSLQCEDVAAKEIQKVCEKIGIDYDSQIECHHSGAILCVRRSEKEF
ncbi:hypothetical protein NDA14_001962 [Ustilago hordei]|nr:hypothetical protein NDA10_003971 [Ustilago hordei]KAJ1586247.1 hypothetical protein NDA12_006229 [Ustilago hordei]KAJ1589651.1 hypothetical protein NDA15_007528 [Ustilago hordei]KAJ1600621.1 hypothetical protein NDA14_001962 [Ustilago hordei]UTT93427.1 hypothetical protein NDA17_006791 [Ustilago hordei]